MDYTQLADIYREENSSPQLAKVPAHFYRELRELVEGKRREALEKREDEDADLFIAELRRILFFQKAIVQKRLEKIFFHAARGTRPENMTEEEERLFGALTALREGFTREVYTGERMELSSPLEELERELEEAKAEESKEKVEEAEGKEGREGRSGEEREGEGMEKAGGEGKEREEPEEGSWGSGKERPQEERFMQVLITEYVEAYRGLDGNIYGPYKEGEKVKLPKEEGEWLIMAGMAKEVK